MVLLWLLFALVIISWVTRLIALGVVLGIIWFYLKFEDAHNHLQYDDKILLSEDSYSDTLEKYIKEVKEKGS